MGKLLYLKLSLVVVLVLGFVSPALAVRKESVFGNMLNKVTESVKTGAAVVKEDINNYNTFIVNFDIDNRSGDTWTVEVWKPGKDDQPESYRRIDPWQHERWKMETTAYIHQRDYRVEYHHGGHSDSDVFDPSKQDFIRRTLR